MEREFLDHEVILRAALAKHAKAMEAAHKQLVTTAMKVAIAAKEPTLVTNALAISNNYYHQALGASRFAEVQVAAARDKYNKNKRQRTCSESDDSVSSVTKKSS